jgi:hypothetical protein
VKAEYNVYAVKNHLFHHPTKYFVTCLPQTWKTVKDAYCMVALPTGRLLTRARHHTTWGHGQWRHEPKRPWPLLEFNSNFIPYVVSVYCKSSTRPVISIMNLHYMKCKKVSTCLSNMYRRTERKWESCCNFTIHIYTLTYVYVYVREREGR